MVAKQSIRVCPCWFCRASQHLSIPLAIASSWPVFLGWDLEALFYSGSVLPGGENSETGVGELPFDTVACGVLQGSVLSPMLFNIYMKLLKEIVWSSGV